jgi:WD40 repeat protein
MNNDIEIEKPTKIFFSYSRKDSTELNELRQYLDESSFESLVDQDQISKGEDWQKRLSSLIETANIFVFLISDSSLSSEICQWELAKAFELKMRIFPVIIGKIKIDKVPPDLLKLHITYLKKPIQLDQNLNDLIVAMEQDIELIRKHTNLTERAVFWKSRKTPSRLLLKGPELEEIEAWYTKADEANIKLNELQASFIAASKLARVRFKQYSILAVVSAILLAVTLQLFFGQLQTEKNESEKLAQINDAKSKTSEAGKLFVNDRAVEAANLVLSAWPDNADDSRPMLAEAWALFLNILPELNEKVRYNFTKSVNVKAGLKMKFSEFENLILINKGTNILGFDSLTGNLKFELVGHSKDIYSIEYDNQSGTIFSGSADGSIKAWDAKSGVNLYTIQTENSKVWSLKIGTSGAYLISGGSENVFQVWDLATKEEKLDLRIVLKGKQVKLSSSGRFLSTLTNGVENISGQIIEASSNEVKLDTTALWAPPKLNSSESHFALLHNSSLSHGAEGSFTDGISLWNLRNLKRKFHVLKGEAIANVVFDSKNEYFISESFDNVIRLHEFDTGEVVHTLLNSHGHMIDSKFNAKSDQLELVTVHASGAVFLWRKDTISEYPGHEDEVLVANFSSDGLYLVTGSRDKKIIVWNLKANRKAATLSGHDEGIRKVFFFNNTNGIVSLSFDNTVRLWDITNVSHPYISISQNEGEVGSIIGEFSTYESSLVTWFKNENPNYDIVGRGSFDTINLENPISALNKRKTDFPIHEIALASDSDWLAAWPKGSLVKFMSLSESHEITFDFQRGRVSTVRLIPDSALAVVSGSRGILATVDYKENKIHREYLLPEEYGEVYYTDALMSKNSARLIAIFRHKNKSRIAVWNVNSGELINVIGEYKYNPIVSFIDSGNAFVISERSSNIKKKFSSRIVHKILSKDASLVWKIDQTDFGFNSIAWNNDAVFLGNSNGEIYSWKSSDKSPKKQFAINEPTELSIKGLRQIDLSGNYLIAQTSFQVFVFDIISNKLLFSTFPLPSLVIDAKFSGDGKVFIIYSSGGVLEAYGTESWARFHQVDLEIKWKYAPPVDSDRGAGAKISVSNDGKYVYLIPDYWFPSNSEKQIFPASKLVQIPISSKNIFEKLCQKLPRVWSPTLGFSPSHEKCNAIDSLPLFKESSPD